MRLEPLPSDDFPAWADRSRRGFVDQQVAAGVLPRPDAERYATEQLAALLPDGPVTPGHHLWSVVHDGDPVAHVWLHVRPSGPAGLEAYLVDIEVLPHARGRGLGRATMLAVEDAARSLGARRIRLNVFGHNAVARRLYDDLGYRVTATLLVKRLESPPATYDDLGGVPAGEAGGVRLTVVDRSDGRHALGQLEGAADDLGAVLEAAERWSRERRAVAVEVSVQGGDGASGCAKAGFRVAAEARTKVL